MSMMKERTCRNCQLKMTEKNKDSFVKTSTGGYATQCKKCRSLESKAKYDANKPNKKHRQITEDSQNLKGCLYLEGTKFITNVYSYPSNRR
jgi:hypothetical protein